MMARAWSRIAAIFLLSKPPARATGNTLEAIIKRHFAILVTAVLIVWGVAPWNGSLKSQTANAAELSRSHVLGFSGNGRYFVFEEFGIQDGSGIPYANLYVIDVETDRWLKGTPIRLKGTEAESLALERSLSEDGITDQQQIERRFEAALEDKRNEVKTKAASVLAAIGDLWPAFQQAHNPPFEFTSDAKTVRFSGVGYQNLVNSEHTAKGWQLEVEEKVFPATENCFSLYENMKGFTLTLTNEKSGAKTVLNNDTRIPNSRSCPQGYHIEEVLTFPRGGGRFSLAVLIRYGRPGFEGPDGRLLAVTKPVTP